MGSARDYRSPTVSSRIKILIGVQSMSLVEQHSAGTDLPHPCDVAMVEALRVERSSSSANVLS